MNDDSGDGGVDGVGNVAVRAAHPIVENGRERGCVWRRRRGWCGLASRFRRAVGMWRWLVCSLEADPSNNTDPGWGYHLLWPRPWEHAGEGWNGCGGGRER
eukprot:4215097-Prymnesium_polylepis.1